MSVADIFYLAEESKIPRLVETAALHVIRIKMLITSLPNKSIEFKTERPRVSVIF